MHDLLERIDPRSRRRGARPWSGRDWTDELRSRGRDARRDLERGLRRTRRRTADAWDEGTDLVAEAGEELVLVLRRHPVRATLFVAGALMVLASLRRR